MKVGIKTYSWNEVSRAKIFAKKTDFMEIMPLIGHDYKKFKAVGLPIVIHAAHFRFGYNPANTERWDKTEEIVNLAIEAADFFDSDKIIIHPGVRENEECTIKNTLKFFSVHNDKRMLVENMPGDNPLKITFFCETPEEVKDFIKQLGCGFCMDFQHAMCSAAKMKVDSIRFIKQFMEINPKHFHISDGMVSSTIDYSKHLGEGEFPLETFKEMIGDGWVTIETDIKSDEKQMSDIAFLRK